MATPMNNTGNAVGSVAPADLQDNAQVLDKLLGGSAQKVTGRLGKELKSWSGIEADLDAIVTSLDTANFTFPSEPAGLTGTTNGQYFRVPQGVDNRISFKYLRNQAGLAVPVADVAGYSLVIFNEGVSLKNAAKIISIDEGRESPSLSIEQGIYRLSTGQAEPSTDKAVRTPGYIFMRAGDRLSVPYDYNVAGCIYSLPDERSFQGEFFAYATTYLSLKDCFMRLVLRYVGSDKSIDLPSSSYFNKLVVARNSQAILANLKDATIPSSAINLSLYQSNYPIEPGNISSGNGADGNPVSTNVQRTKYIKVFSGDIFSVTDPMYVISPFFYDEQKNFISATGVWSPGSITVSSNGYIRIATKRVDNGPSINNIALAEWIEGPSSISRLPPNTELIPDGSIPFSKISFESTRSDFPITEGNISSSNGYDGGVTSTFVHRTGVIEVGKGDVLSVTDSAYLYSPFYYDSSGIFLSADGQWHSSNLISQVDGFVRFTTKRADNGPGIKDQPIATWLEISAVGVKIITNQEQVGPDTISEMSLTPELRSKISTSGAKQWTGKTWYTLGDSIIARGWYQPLVAEVIGAKGFNNYGVGGTTIAKLSENDTTAMSVRWNGMGSNPDLITVWGGVNDFGYSYGKVGGTDLGVFSDTTPLTFYGGLKTIIEGITVKYPGVKLVFVITTPVSNAMGMRLKNAKGFYLSDYCKAVREVCEYYSIPYLDLQLKSGFNEKNIGIMTSNIGGTASDGLHPSRLGMQQISTKLSAFLDSI